MFNSTRRIKRNVDCWKWSSSFRWLFAPLSPRGQTPKLFYKKLIEFEQNNFENVLARTKGKEIVLLRITQWMLFWLMSNSASPTGFAITGSANKKWCIQPLVELFLRSIIFHWIRDIVSKKIEQNGTYHLTMVEMRLTISPCFARRLPVFLEISSS